METPELCSQSVRTLGGLGVSALPAHVWIEDGLKKTLHQNFGPTLGTYSEYRCCWSNRNVYENGRQKLVRYGRPPKRHFSECPPWGQEHQNGDVASIPPKWAALPKGQNVDETRHPGGHLLLCSLQAYPAQSSSQSFKTGHFLKDSLVAVE